MLHPVGTQSNRIYWRRRLLLVVAPLVLIAVTLWVVLGSGSGAKKNADASTPRPTTPVPVTTSSHPATTPSSRVGSSSTKAPSASTGAAKTTTACVRGQLRVSAVTGASSYTVGQQPLLMLQVINAGAKPCIQNLADSQVELRVYNGQSRVWGSHDCKIEPGTTLRTLAVGQSVRISVTWTGLSSQPGCGGTRQRVGAGTYTLYPYLAGTVGAVAQFSIT